MGNQPLEQLMVCTPPGKTALKPLVAFSEPVPNSPGTVRNLGTLPESGPKPPQSSRDLSRSLSAAKETGGSRVASRAPKDPKIPSPGTQRNTVKSEMNRRPTEGNQTSICGNFRKWTPESQSKPGTKMVNPEPCKELERRPQLFSAGTASY